MVKNPREREILEINFVCLRWMQPNAVKYWDVASKDDLFESRERRNALISKT